MSNNNSKLYFDSLNHAKMLQEGGVEHADVHTGALMAAMDQNVYTKAEVENMIEAALKRFDASIQATFQKFDDRTHQMQREFDDRSHQMEKNILETNNKTIHRLTWNIGLIVTLLTIVGGVMHFGFH